MSNIKINKNAGNKSIVIFGAGKIGRSFIGQLFGRSGYEVVFVDIDPVIIAALNERKSYPIVIKGDKKEHILVTNVSAISGLDKVRVAETISDASIMAVSVGKNALGKVIPVVAKGLIYRFNKNSEQPLDIIIAENIRSGGEFIRQRLLEYLPIGYPMKKLVGLVETSIGKMVPIVNEEELEKDPLLLYAEPYNTLILDRKGFKCSLPVVEGLAFKNNIQAWVDRKVFIHNLGHATVAYYGYFKYPGMKYVYEVLKDKDVYSFAYNVMHQAAEVLQVIYPDEYSLQELEGHIDDLLNRFQNKALRDTIFRVGKDIPRKLGPADRFVGIIRLAIQQGMAYNNILEAMVYGLFFRCADEYGKLFPSDKDFIDNFNRMGLDYILKTVCMFDPNIDLQLIKKINELYVNLRLKFLKNINKNNSDEY